MAPQKQFTQRRDLKLDNTLLDGSRPPRVKLCDFGFAKDFKPGENMLTNIGWGSTCMTLIDLGLNVVRAAI